MDINSEILQLNWKREPYGLYEPIEYTLAAGGKRVRPQLAMIACELFDGKAEENCTRSYGARSFSQLHTSTR